MTPDIADLPLFAKPALADTETVAQLARTAMITLFRQRTRLLPADSVTAASVSAIDLGEWLDGYGWAADRRWSVVVFVRPKGLWRVTGMAKNPRRHGAVTVTYELDESRAKELGL